MRESFANSLKCQKIISYHFIIGNQQQDAHELLVTVLNTLQDIKIPVPTTNNIATTDVIDHASVGCNSQSEKENIGSGKKGKQKKTSKSIFYTNSGGSSVQCSSSNSLSSSSSSFVSNGFRSPTKSDQITSGVGCKKGKYQGRRQTKHSGVGGVFTTTPNLYANIL